MVIQDSVFQLVRHPNYCIMHEQWWEIIHHVLKWSLPTLPTALGRPALHCKLTSKVEYGLANSNGTCLGQRTDTDTQQTAIVWSQPWPPMGPTTCTDIHGIWMLHYKATKGDQMLVTITASLPCMVMMRYHQLCMVSMVTSSFICKYMYVHD